METAWIVTREENQYDQMGEYFCGVFLSRPSVQNLKDLLPGEDEVTISELYRGGGRQDVEDTWYNLHKVKPGEYFVFERVF